VLLLFFNQPAVESVEASIAQTLPEVLQSLRIDAGTPEVQFGGGVAPRPSRLLHITQMLPVPHQRLMLDVGDDDLAMLVLLDVVEAR